MCLIGSFWCDPSMRDPICKAIKTWLGSNSQWVTSLMFHFNNLSCEANKVYFGVFFYAYTWVKLESNIWQNLNDKQIKLLRTTKGHIVKTFLFFTRIIKTKFKKITKRILMLLYPLHFCQLYYKKKRLIDFQKKCNSIPICLVYIRPILYKNSKTQSF